MSIDTAFIVGYKPVTLSKQPLSVNYMQNGSIDACIPQQIIEMFQYILNMLMSQIISWFYVMSPMILMLLLILMLLRIL